VWQLFSMQSGLNYDSSDAFDAAVKKNGTTNQLMETAVLSIPMSFKAGEHWKYACRNHDALGCIIEVISGMPFPEYLNKNMFEPLEMEHIGFELKGFIKENIADIFRKADDGNGLVPLPREDYKGYTENYKSGGQGLIGNIKTYARFAVAMANGGVGESGARILKQETIDLMKVDRLTDGIRGDYRFSPFGYGYGLGVRTLINKDKGAPSAIGEFGWDGAAGAYTLMDNENNIAIVFLTHALSGNKNLDQLKIRDLTYKGIFG
jgi:CubicO group peptidase (beta-lactamase class C family)